MVWDTVAVETPASLATSLMVTFMKQPPCAMRCPFTQINSHISIVQLLRRVKTLFPLFPLKIVKNAIFLMDYPQPAGENVI